MIPKEIKYNLHYDDVRGDFFTAAKSFSVESSFFKGYSLFLKTCLTAFSKGFVYSKNIFIRMKSQTHKELQQRKALNEYQQKIIL